MILMYDLASDQTLNVCVTKHDLANEEESELRGTTMDPYLRSELGESEHHSLWK
jgi:hypothetical protein